MARREPDPLPSAIPTPRAAPVSTYYDPRLPLPKIDPTVAELGKLADSLSRFGLMRRQDEKEELKAGATADAWGDVTDEEIQELVDAALSPDVTDAPAPGAGAEEISAEAAAVDAEFDEAHKELRQRFLGFREDGLPKNADPFYRKWYAKVMAQRLASGYSAEIGGRLKETYELSADTGKPVLDYSDLSAEIYEKYEGLVTELGIHGEEAFASLKGVSDQKLSAAANEQFRAREDAQATQEWTINGVTKLVEMGGDGAFSEEELADLEKHYGDARFEVPEVREHFTANIQAAANRFLQMERDGQLEQGRGKELALELLETLVPSGDEDGTGLVLGTSIKNDVQLQSVISTFKDALEANYEKDNVERERRQKNELIDGGYAIAMAAQQGGAAVDGIKRALENHFKPDGLTDLEVDAIGSLVRQVGVLVTEAEVAGEWDKNKKNAMYAEFLRLKHEEGKTNDELKTWIFEEQAHVGDSSRYGAILDQIDTVLASDIQDDPQIATAISAAKGQVDPNYGGEYQSSVSALETQMMTEVNAEQDPVKRVQIAQEYEAKFREATAAERTRVRGIYTAVGDALDDFDPAGARTAFEAARDSLSEPQERKLQAQIDAFKPEQVYLNEISRGLETIIEAEMSGNALYAQAKNGDLPADISAEEQEAAQFASTLKSRVNELWKAGKGTKPPGEVVNEITYTLREEARKLFEPWMQQVLVPTSTPGSTVPATVSSAVVAGTTKKIQEQHDISNSWSTPAPVLTSVGTWQSSGTNAGSWSILPRLEAQTQYSDNPDSEAFERTTFSNEQRKDLDAIQFFLKSEDPPKDQDGLPAGILSGDPTTDWGKRVANSSNLSPEERDAVAISVGRTRLIGVDALLSGTWTIPADDAPPNLSAMGEYRVGRYGGTPLGRSRQVPSPGLLGTKSWRWEKFSYGHMAGKWGRQSDRPVNISPDRLAALGLPAFSPKTNLFIQNQDDFNALHELATGTNLAGDEIDTVSVGGTDVPLVEAQRRFLAAFGINEGTVAHPDSLSDEKLVFWIKDIQGSQLQLIERWKTGATEEE